MKNFNIPELEKAREKVAEKADELMRIIKSKKDQNEASELIMSMLNKHELLYFTMLMNIVDNTNAFIGELLSRLTGLEISNQIEMFKYLAKTLKVEDVIILSEAFGKGVIFKG